MYNTISSFDANLAGDPTNIVETKKQDGTRIVGPLKSSSANLAGDPTNIVETKKQDGTRMVGPLKSSSFFSFKLNYCSILLPLQQFFDNYFRRDLFTRCLQGNICMDFYYTC